MPELTPEQETRKALLLDLCQAVNFQELPSPPESAYPINVIEWQIEQYGLPSSKPLWIHFTDWYGQFDLDKLLDSGLLERHPTLVYEPDGTWKDRFPPTAYRLTPIGEGVLAHKSDWVFIGKW